jgi:hypothetical protein
MARGLEHGPRGSDGIGDVDSLHGDRDAQAEPVAAAADLGYKVGGKHGRDHLVGETLVELGSGPVPRTTTQVGYLEQDRVGSGRHLRRLTR